MKYLYLKILKSLLFLWRLFPKLPHQLQQQRHAHFQKYERDLHLFEKEMERFISALFIEMFGDPETNPKKWEVVSLGDEDGVVGFTYGTNKRSSEQPEGIPVLRVPNILRGDIEVVDLKYADLPVKE